MLQAGIETRVIFRQSDILPLKYCPFSVDEWIFRFIFIYAYRLTECWIHEKRFVFSRMWLPAIPHSSVQPTGGGYTHTHTHIYRYIYIWMRFGIKSENIYIFTCMCMFVCIPFSLPLSLSLSLSLCMYVCLFMWVWVYMHSSVCVCVCVLYLSYSHFFSNILFLSEKNQNITREELLYLIHIIRKRSTIFCNNLLWGTFFTFTF